MAVPLLRGRSPLGVMSVARPTIGRFSDNQVALLRIFAEQAVIAITSAETYRALQARTADLQESLEYQTATSDVLKVISSSNFALEPVFSSVVNTAVRLCHADQAVIYRVQDGAFRWAAGTNMLPEYERIERGVAIRPGTGTLIGRVALEARPVQILDAWTDPLYEVKDDARAGGVHTMLGVPLLRNGEPIGAIGLARRRVESYSDQEVELVTIFADQAVIAIENARLVAEQREALEQQTATAEVLQVINASPGNLVPVFEAMLDRAMRLCEGVQGTLWIFDGERMRATATAGYSGELTKRLSEWREIHPFQRRLLQGERVFQIIDLAAEELYRSGNALTKAAVDIAGIRTVVFVGLVKDATTLGGFTIGRREIGAFTDKQIALLQNFAAQAVIAMENARLLTEQREALEQQTATAEVLQVINASPGDLMPVFDAILEKAHNLCGAEIGALLTYDGDTVRLAAERNLPPAWADVVRGPWLPRPDHPVARIIRGERLFQIEDMAEIARTSDDPVVQAAVELGGIRSLLLVPLRKDGAFLGYITAYRQEVRPFTEKQIALLENFAAQAVIAMENARLLNEQREALEQQTATAEVLQVINTNPGNLMPVFATILEKAHATCGAEMGSLQVWDGTHVRAMATLGYPSEVDAMLRRPFLPGPRQQAVIAGARLTHSADVTLGHDADNIGDNFWGSSRIRTSLQVPLRHDGVVIGFITANRREVRPFSDKEIALLENFASQAVIAMENARLLSEIRQRQEELRITFENMGDGVAMFDASQRLVAWNSKFQEVFDLPDDLLQQHRTYENTSVSSPSVATSERASIRRNRSLSWLPQPANPTAMSARGRMAG